MNHSTTEVFFDDLVVPARQLIGQEGKGFRYILEGMNAERILIAAECIGDARFFLDRVRAAPAHRTRALRIKGSRPTSSVARPSSGPRILARARQATHYASSRQVFGRKIGANQGVQFPLARAYAATEAAALMVQQAADLYDAGAPCGPEANMAKLLGAFRRTAADRCGQHSSNRRACGCSPRRGAVLAGPAAAEASWMAGEACIQTYGGYAFAEEYDIERKWRETRLYQVRVGGAISAWASLRKRSQW